MCAWTGTGCHVLLPLSAAPSDATGGDPGDPAVSPDGTEILFSAHRATSRDVYRASKGGAAFGPVERVVSISTTHDDYDPVAGAGGQILLISHVTSGAGNGIFVSYGQGPPVAVPEVNSLAHDEDPYIDSALGVLLFTSNREKGGEKFDIYISTFAPY